MTRLEFDCHLHYPGAPGFRLEASFTTEAMVTGLVGPSGSGKTTILSLIAGLRKPDRGRIRLGDRVLFDKAAGLSLTANERRVGYVFQDYLLFPHLDVRRNLLYGWRRRRANARSVSLERVVQVLELTDLLDRMPHTLSGGQRQRVAVGRALLCGPELLLLDEPLASVDSELRQRVLTYLEAAIAEWQVPTIYVTHDPREVKRLAQWVVTLDNGRVVASERV